MFALRHAGAVVEAWARLRGGSQRADPEEVRWRRARWVPFPASGQACFSAARSLSRGSAGPGWETRSERLVIAEGRGPSLSFCAKAEAA